MLHAHSNSQFHLCEGLTTKQKKNISEYVKNNLMSILISNLDKEQFLECAKQNDKKENDFAPVPKPASLLR
jgi:hypothetical protein